MMHDLIDQLACLAGLRDIEALDASMCEIAQRWLTLSRVAIHRVVEDGGRRRWLTTRCGLSTSDPGHGECGVASTLPLLEECPLLHECLLTEQSNQVAGRPHQTFFPLVDNRGAKGVMELHSGAPLSATQQQLMASLLGFHRHLRGLMDDNERDSLTGLLNRKSFDEAFVRAAMATDELQAEGEDNELDGLERRAAADPARHWLAVVDIDHFKRVNDEFGHLIGDEVLILVAQLMGQTFRHGDRIYRFGGEEFVVLLRCPDMHAARTAFDRLRHRIGSHAFPQVGQLTVSIGYTAIDADDTPGLAFERADLAVYQAKNEGRNRTIAHADLAVPAQAEVPRGELEFF